MRKANEGAGREEWDFARYRRDPAGFARDVLDSTWWRAQEEIGRLLARHRRVAVKAANGVGKTYLAADLVLWFLYCHPSSVVLTTAPTWRQVESLLWEEIRKRHRAVNARAEAAPLRPKLEGSALQTRLKIAEGHFAMGLSTDEPVRFQGFHAENLLIVLDEACGVPEDIWDAVEGICVGRNNRVLAISNPLAPVGRFYSLFTSPRWKTVTVSALAHPNVRRRRASPGGKASFFPGAVTRAAVEDRIDAWCDEISVETEGEEMPEEAELPDADVDTFVWEGRRYRPNAQFRVRVLGEFPLAAEDSLFALSWVEAAMKPGVGGRGRDFPYPPTPNPQPLASDLCILAVDVARFGSDETVFAVRRGERVTRLLTAQGLNTMEVAGRTRALAQEENAEVVTVDEIGVGAGVVDRLEELGLAGLIPVNFGARPSSGRDSERFLNLRAQTYWTLRERFRTGQIRLPKDERLAAQLASLRYNFTSSGQIQIESKDDLRRRGLSSPDRADAIALLFGPSATAGLFLFSPRPQASSANRAERAEPVRWLDVSKW